MNRAIRRRLKRIVHKDKDANYCRRANAMLLLYEGYYKNEIARLLQAARSTLDDWIQRYEIYGELVR
ncbi:MAG: helix-turn-helix domain-containing protein [Proteobacteria bacterium]|nr:helix-turn-helix domain-containing protein [Pseudomonadota bacterium]